MTDECRRCGEVNCTCLIERAKQLGIRERDLCVETGRPFESDFHKEEESSGE